MTLSNAQKVEEFHVAMGMTNGVWPPNAKEIDLRWTLIVEELDEVWKEIYPERTIGQSITRQEPDHLLNKQKVAKELADLLYVVYGTAVSFGILIDEVFDEVHKSNMSKLVDGKPVKREDGKVLKGPNYKPPRLELIFK